MRYLAIAALMIGLLVSPLQAEWKEPADGALTEPQVTRYLGAMKDIGDLAKATGKAAEGQNGLAAMGLWARTSEKYKAILAKHQFTEEEFNWTAGKVTESWVNALMEMNWEKKALPGIKDREKSLAAEIEAQKAKLAQYEAASKAGTKVLDADARKAAIDRATEEQKSAEADAKTADDEIKAQQKEIADKETAAKAAEALAAKPPAEVTADEREGYIEGKKQEAAGLRDEVKGLRDALGEKEKSKKDSLALTAAAKSRAEHPERPATDDEKTATAAENEAGVKNTRDSIKASEEGLALISESRAAGQKQMDEMSKNVPRGNIDLLKKHYSEFCDAVGMKNDFAEEKK